VSKYGTFDCVQFIREDLEHNDDGAIHAHFHGTDDLISVHELWQIWVNSTGESADYYDVKNFTLYTVVVGRTFAVECVIRPCLSHFFSLPRMSGTTSRV